MTAPTIAPTTVTHRATIRDYVALTKPRIIELLLITTVPAMIAAAGGWPGWSLVVGTVTAGALVSASAHATNMVLDRDIDAVMSRTANRPLPTGRIAPHQALAFAVALLVVGSVTMAAIAGPVAATLTLAAWLWYVVLYTVVLKRRTAQNIVIGGAAGAAPPVIGWAAVTGRVALPALVMFVVVVAWTPLHFWSLAVATGTDYARAGVPMLPAVAGPRAAARHAAVYAVGTVAVTAALPATGIGGLPLLAILTAAGGWLLAGARRFAADPTPTTAAASFHRSNAYLALVFVAIAVTGGLS